MGEWIKSLPKRVQNMTINEVPFAHKFWNNWINARVSRKCFYIWYVFTIRRNTLTELLADHLYNYFCLPLSSAFFEQCSAVMIRIVWARRAITPWSNMNDDTSQQLRWYHQCCMPTACSAQCRTIVLKFCDRMLGADRWRVSSGVVRGLFLFRVTGFLQAFLLIELVICIIFLLH